MEYGKCKKCKNSYPVEEFKVNHKLTHGIEKVCKGCRAGIEYNDFGRAIDPIAWDYMREEIYFRDRGICYLCGSEVSIFEYEIDHYAENRDKIEKVKMAKLPVILRRMTKSELLAAREEWERWEELSRKPTTDSISWDTSSNVAVVHSNCKKSKDSGCPTKIQQDRFEKALRNPSLSQYKDWIEAKHT